MKNNVLALVAAVALCTSHTGCANDPGLRTSTPTKRAAGIANDSQSSRETLERFIAAFGRGDARGVVDCFDPSATITAVRTAERKSGELFGSYRGTTGAEELLATLGRTFDTKAFEVHTLIADGETAVARGSFTHELKTTGKLYSSDWVLTCVIRGGKIVDYRFFEDSASYEQANTGPTLAIAP